ncbi:beta-glucosidase 40-like [Macadamia integrifolia]|uniref:beta-glucosidase 40-like n=1 Tax=Macadamia integrifolia TaxID=60698 RepID=UPI001C4FD9F3|nr:beta-glucosidase 40-like [Macadamia integrifolia]
MKMKMMRNVIIWVLVVVGFEFQRSTCQVPEIKRTWFPKDFVFGTASSAFQVEGAVKEGGRGPTIWDTYTHTPGNIFDQSNADVTVDQYHRYKEDVQLIKDMGMDAYRFSIAWSRIFPNGTGQVNQAGVDYYNNLINALLAKGIQPYVTLYHWDLPQALDDKYNGWLSPKIIKDYATFAETCFEKFGDRVKYWITFNEPQGFAIQGYDGGLQAPGRCSVILNQSCKPGNSTVEPYLVTHNVLLSHATVVNIYRKKYKPTQKGSLGIAFNVMWYEPMSNTTEDIEATQRAMDFQFGWYMDPLSSGDYPSSMRSRVGSRLPTFSKAESALVKGSLDFVGINHYTTNYVTRLDRVTNDTMDDYDAMTSPVGKDGKEIGEMAGSIWLYVVPRGIRSLMNYIRQKYANPPVIITENGVDESNDPSKPLKNALKDEKRIIYYSGYLSNLLASIKEDGCNVKGYFAWSLVDNWEWAAGYTSRFGLYFVDFKDNLKRYPKDSVEWFKTLLAS